MCLTNKTLADPNIVTDIKHLGNPYCHFRLLIVLLSVVSGRLFRLEVLDLGGPEKI